MLGFTYGSIAVVMMEPVFLTPLAEESLGITELQARTVTSAFFVGFFIGLCIWGYVGDNYGRRPVLVATLILMTISGACAHLMPEFITFLLMRALVGISAAGVLNTTFVVAVEFAPCSWRAVAKGVLAVGWTGGSLFLVGLAWVLDTHSMPLFSLCVLPAVVAVLINYAWLPESPRWMLVSGDPDKARERLIVLAEVNLKPD